MRFSVIIPTLGRSEMLARALDSVDAQQGIDLEIIVIDDGSPKDEATRIASLVAARPHARLVRRETNGGAPRARNAGVAAASGEIIAFLDSDDWWMPGRLARHAPLYDDPTIVASYNSAQVTREGERQSVKEFVGRRASSGWRMVASLAGWNFIGGCSLVCMRKRVFHAAGGFDLRLPAAQDWDLWLKVAQQGEFSFIDERLGYYDAGPHVRITTSSNKVLGAHEIMYRRGLALAQTSAERRYVAMLHRWVRAEIALRFGDGSKALGHYVSALLSGPSSEVVRRSRTFLPQAVALALRRLV